jgi:hypothetical protein
MYKMTPGSASIVQQRGHDKETGNEMPAGIACNHLITKDMLWIIKGGPARLLLFFPWGKCKGNQLP